MHAILHHPRPPQSRIHFSFLPAYLPINLPTTTYPDTYLLTGLHYLPTYLPYSVTNIPTTYLELHVPRCRRLRGKLPPARLALVPRLGSSLPTNQRRQSPVWPDKDALRPAEFAHAWLQGPGVGPMDPFYRTPGPTNERERDREREREQRKHRERERERAQREREQREQRKSTY